MDINQIKSFLTEIKKHNLLPNEYIVLSFILNKEPIPKIFDEQFYLRLLALTGWIESDKTPTEKCKALGILNYDEKLFLKNVELYRLMWPAITLPNGKIARGSLKELEDRFRWFFTNHPYDWNTVFKATEAYLKYYKEKNYTFMRTSSFFIFKEVTPKLKTSDLAAWCEQLNNNDKPEDGFDINI